MMKNGKREGKTLYIHIFMPNKTLSIVFLGKIKKDDNNSKKKITIKILFIFGFIKSPLFVIINIGRDNNA